MFDDHINIANFSGVERCSLWLHLLWLNIAERSGKVNNEELFVADDSGIDDIIYQNIARDSVTGDRDNVSSIDKCVGRGSEEHVDSQRLRNESSCQPIKQSSTDTRQRPIPKKRTSLTKNNRPTYDNNLPATNSTGVIQGKNGSEFNTGEYENLKHTDHSYMTLARSQSVPILEQYVDIDLDAIIPAVPPRDPIL